MISDVSRWILDIRDRVLAGGKIAHDEAVELLAVEGADAMDLFAAANHVREKFRGRAVHLCAIVNAKSGNCPEDCGFCAQSVHSRAEVPKFPLLSVDEMLAAARRAEEMGARCFGIVTSGRRISAVELDRVCEAVARIRRELKVLPDASLGTLTPATAEKLKAAGLNGYHHNVESARSYYPVVCSTRSYDENLETLRVAKRAGFHVCSGGLFGIGETPAQRVEMAETLREEDVDRVCLNFFMPVKGTRFEDAAPMTPVEILKTIAAYRMLLPSKDINICGGREMHLRDVQGMMFLAGASATMLGSYLTQAGRDAKEDLQLLRDLGLEPMP
jgi:biotin synthase